MRHVRRYYRLHEKKQVEFAMVVGIKPKTKETDAEGHSLKETRHRKGHVTRAYKEMTTKPFTCY